MTEAFEGGSGNGECGIGKNSEVGMGNAEKGIGKSECGIE